MIFDENYDFFAKFRKTPRTFSGIRNAVKSRYILIGRFYTSHDPICLDLKQPRFHFLVKINQNKEKRTLKK